MLNRPLGSSVWSTITPAPATFAIVGWPRLSRAAASRMSTTASAWCVSIASLTIAR
jgi:hypothetical protein